MSVAAKNILLCLDTYPVELNITLVRMGDVLNDRYNIVVARKKECIGTLGTKRDNRDVVLGYV